MEIIVAALVLGAVIYFVVTTRKIKRWNNDEKQQQLVQFLVAAGRGDTSPVTNFIIRQDWSARETRSRLAHALTVVPTVTDRATYEKAKDYAKMLHDASYKLG